MRPTESSRPKYQVVHDTLRDEILAGRVRRGDRLPSEAELVQRFGASRITVGRALRELQLAGLIERRAGSGTFVRRGARRESRVFGVLIAERSDTDIFEPMAEGLAGAPSARGHGLLWGHAAPDDSREAVAWDLCRQYIDRRVDGVFFAPLESTPNRDEVNARIIDAFDAARVPVVLLDRPVVPYPQRSRHDLVGIDNRRAGHLMAAHLLSLGARRLAFAAPPRAAATVDAREAGFREAVYAAGLPLESCRVARFDAADASALRALLATAAPDAIVCANDRFAGRLMHTLMALDRRVPDDVRLVGIDDADYAALLPVPLTTLRQPAREIGMAAMAAMLGRIDQPALPPRDILLHATLVVRESCGAARAASASDAGASRPAAGFIAALPIADADAGSSDPGLGA